MGVSGYPMISKELTVLANTFKFHYDHEIGQYHKNNTVSANTRAAAKNYQRIEEK